MPLDSIESVKKLLDENEELVDEIKDAAGEGADQIKALADRLEKNREEAEKMLEDIDSIRFSIGKDDVTRATQRQLLKDIEEFSAKIKRYENSNTMLADQYRNRLAAAHNEMAGTYAASIAQVVTFDQAEKDELQSLMKQAVLDTESRKKQAALLAGAVGISKLLLKTATKLVA